MARTKASAGAKVSAGKSSKARCSVVPPVSNFVSSGGGERSSRSHSGGNPMCPRDTPKWQKPITNFFISNSNGIMNSESKQEEINTENARKSKPKRNIIESDDEEEVIEKPKNTVLDESIELEPLTGENSHKLEEYYPKNSKDKMKESNKENIDITTRKSLKRDLDVDDEEIGHTSKKIKL